jgi:hypothetical protein
MSAELTLSAVRIGDRLTSARPVLVLGPSLGTSARALWGRAGAVLAENSWRPFSPRSTVCSPSVRSTTRVTRSVPLVWKARVPVDREPAAYLRVHAELAALQACRSAHASPGINRDHCLSAGVGRAGIRHTGTRTAGVAPAGTHWPNTTSHRPHAGGGTHGEARCPGAADVGYPRPPSPPPASVRMEIPGGQT